VVKLVDTLDLGS